MLYKNELFKYWYFSSSGFQEDFLDALSLTPFYLQIHSKFKNMVPFI